MTPSLSQGCVGALRREGHYVCGPDNALCLLHIMSMYMSIATLTWAPCCAACLLFLLSVAILKRLFAIRQTFYDALFIYVTLLRCRRAESGKGGTMKKLLFLRPLY